MTKVCCNSCSYADPDLCAITGMLRPYGNLLSIYRVLPVQPIKAQLSEEFIQAVTEFEVQLVLYNPPYPDGTPDRLIRNGLYAAAEEAIAIIKEHYTLLCSPELMIRGERWNTREQRTDCFEAVLTLRFMWRHSGNERKN